MSVFKQFCKKHNIILRKGENLHILTTLVWNNVLLLKLRLFKWLRGIQHPIIHYYAVCWNEEKMLPFMFDYYERFIDHFTIYDNYSDDQSESIIQSHQNTTIRKFSMNGQINDNIYLEIKNNCWKHSRGKADYVIVCDIDEFLYHSDIEAFLNDSAKRKYSFFHTNGYDMYSQKYPNYKEGELITNQIKLGIYNNYYDKPILFDPHRIVEIHYEIGAHKAHPCGIVKRPESPDKLKLLHYKNLSLEHILERISIYAARLSDVNKENKWGDTYLAKEKHIREEFQRNLADSNPIIP